LVITTSTITVGCNFDVKDHFDKIYCHVGAESRNFVTELDTLKITNSCTVLIQDTEEVIFRPPRIR
jgi:hypothetical protein